VRGKGFWVDKAALDAALQKEGIGRKPPEKGRNVRAGARVDLRNLGKVRTHLVLREYVAVLEARVHRPFGVFLAKNAAQFAGGM